MSVQEENINEPANAVELPSPTVWPMVLALGIALILAGTVTHWAVSALGLVLMLRAAVGWFREVLPQEHREPVLVTTEVAAIATTRGQVDRFSAGDSHRKMLPVETYTITAGIKGGAAGGVAMIVPAILYGLIHYHSVWYAVNLLAAAAFVGWGNASTAFLCAFHMDGLVVAAAIHVLASLLVGTLYGAMLPMFPKKPILTAGFVAPLLWSGLLYTTLGVVNPLLDQRIDWLWFIASQFAFGLVAGFVVNLNVRVRTPQFQSLPFVARAGLETQGSQSDRVDEPK
ncbi:MAG: hypothetical protein WA871_14405 [Candidatus Acidiferrales bacterium]